MNSLDIELKKHKFLLLCEDHYNPLGICRSLGEVGITPIPVLSGELHHMIPHCRYVKKLHRVKTMEEGLELIINIYGNEQYKPFIYTSSDNGASLVDNNYDRLKDKFYLFNGGKQGRINFYMDKNNICDLAVSCGIDKPKGETLKRGELPQSLRYPVFTKVTKSTLGGWKNDVFICKDEDELKEAYTHIKADELLVQEFIDKKGEICFDGFSINGGDEVWMPYTARYLRFTPKSYGVYMEMVPYNDKILLNKVQNILKKAHYSGIFEVEILVDKNDHLYFLEVNFRNSTWSYAYTYGGLNLPYQWAKSTLAGHIDYNSATIRQEPFKVMSEFEDFGQNLQYKFVSLYKWWKQCKACDCYYNYNKLDKKPFLYELCHVVSQKVKHMVFGFNK